MDSHTHSNFCHAEPLYINVNSTDLDITTQGINQNRLKNINKSVIFQIVCTVCHVFIKMSQNGKEYINHKLLFIFFLSLRKSAVLNLKGRELNFCWSNLLVNASSLSKVWACSLVLQQRERKTAFWLNGSRDWIQDCSKFLFLRCWCVSVTTRILS